MRAVVIVAAAIALVAVGLWYGNNGPEVEVRQAEPAPVERGTVQPNEALADVFTELEKEWAPAGTTPGAMSLKPVAVANGAGKHHNEKKH